MGEFFNYATVTVYTHHTSKCETYVMFHRGMPAKNMLTGLLTRINPPFLIAPNIFPLRQRRYRQYPIAVRHFSIYPGEDTA